MRATGCALALAAVAALAACGDDAEHVNRERPAASILSMTPSLAKQSYDLLLADRGGLFRDLKPDAKGIATVLALRSKYATPPKTLGDASKYVDLTWYEKAFGTR